MKNTIYLIITNCITIYCSMLINYGRNVCKYPLNSKRGEKSGWGLGGDNLVPKGRKEEGA